MGHGDALLAAGLAQDLYAANPSAGPVLICHRDGSPRWNEVWHDNPAVFKPGRKTPDRRPPYMLSGKGHHPYTKPYSITSGLLWTGWRVRDHRPKLYLSPSETAAGEALIEEYGPFILVEPTAERKLFNRRPPRGFWVDLVRELGWRLTLPLMQLAHPDAEILQNVIPVENRSFRAACGVMQSASLLVTTEGGLVHAAAALGIPTVALYGGCISVEALGYPEHVNIVDDSPQTPCGTLVECPHCIAAWKKITPQRVAEAVQQALQVTA